MISLVWGMKINFKLLNFLWFRVCDIYLWVLMAKMFFVGIFEKTCHLKICEFLVHIFTYL